MGSASHPTPPSSSDIDEDGGGAVDPSGDITVVTAAVRSRPRRGTPDDRFDGDTNAVRAAGWPLSERTQQLVVALAAVHAARATAIRHLTLDDIDLAGRRIRFAGHAQPLSPFVHQVLLGWLQHRQRTWPDTRNRHVLLSKTAATGLAPVSNYHLKYHLLQHGVQLEVIRGDRLLQEALSCGADPLHLAAAFNLSSETAITYSDIARSLLNDAAEAASAAGSAHASSSLEACSGLPPTVARLSFP